MKMFKYPMIPCKPIDHEWGEYKEKGKISIDNWKTGRIIMEKLCSKCGFWDWKGKEL